MKLPNIGKPNLGLKPNQAYINTAFAYLSPNHKIVSLNRPSGPKAAIVDAKAHSTTHGGQDTVSWTVSFPLYTPKQF